MKAIGGLAVRHRRCNHGDRTDPSRYNVANADRGHDGKPDGRGSAVHIQRPRSVLVAAAPLRA